MALIVVVAAHPDDETLFGGGYMASRALEGDDVVVLAATLGEGGEVGEPPVGPQARLGEFREREMRAAVAALGGREVVPLGYRDPLTEIGGTLRPIDVPFDEYSRAIARRLDELRPAVVVTHGSNGEYGHPQHIYTHRAVRVALERAVGWRPSTLVTWCANSSETNGDRLTNQDDPATTLLRLDGTPAFARKVAAVFCYGSQHAMMRRNNRGRPIRDLVRTVEAVRTWELPLPPLPPEPPEIQRGARPPRGP